MKKEPEQTETIVIWLSNVETEQLDKLARKEHKTKEQVALEIIREKLQENKSVEKSRVT